MKAIHLKCVQNVNGLGFTGLSFVPGSKGIYRSVSWEISQADADALVGGWIYLHETKGARSHFGGRVLSVEHSGQVDRFNKPEIAFIIESTVKGKEQKWRGKSRVRAWSGGLVVASLEHEIGSPNA